MFRLNNCMNWNKKKHLTPKQYLIARQSNKDTETTDGWMRSNGLDLERLDVGSTLVFQAIKLAHEVVTQYRYLCTQEQREVLCAFLANARQPDRRTKITPGQCYRTMNITKQLKRKRGQFSK